MCFQSRSQSYVISLHNISLQSFRAKMIVLFCPFVTFCGIVEVTQNTIPVYVFMSSN